MMTSLTRLRSAAADARSRVDDLEQQLRDPHLGIGSPEHTRLTAALSDARSELAAARARLAMRARALEPA